MKYQAIPQGQTYIAEGDPSESNVGITQVTIRRILQLAHPGDALALYAFYSYTARWQNNRCCRCTVAYAMNGLKWSDDRVRRAKAELASIDLIKDEKRVNAETNAVEGWYVRVFYLSDGHPTQNQEGGPEGHPTKKPEGGKSQRVEKRQGNTTDPYESTPDVKRKCTNIPRKSSDGRHSAFVKLFHQGYQKRFGEEPAISGKDVKALKELLSQIESTAEELFSIMERAWQNSKGFYCSKLRSIFSFCSHFNEIRGELKNNGTNGHNGHAHKFHEEGPEITPEYTEWSKKANAELDELLSWGRRKN